MHLLRWRRLTKEHVWADWLKEHIPRTEQGYGEAVEEISPDTAETIVRNVSGNPHVRRIRKVCKTCNNSGMSVIQNSVKPFLSPILRSEPTRLYKPAQRLLSAWYAMAVNIVDHDPATYPAIALADRVALKQNGAPPSHWRIWIGHHPETRQGSLRTKVPIRLHEPGQQADPIADFNTQTMSLFAGPVFFYAMTSSTRLGRKAIKRWTWSSDIMPKLSQIWPMVDNPVSWPLRENIDRRDADFISRAFLDWLRMTADVVDERAVYRFGERGQT